MTRCHMAAVRKHFPHLPRRKSRSGVLPRPWGSFPTRATSRPRQYHGGRPPASARAPSTVFQRQEISFLFIFWTFHLHGAPHPPERQGGDPARDFLVAWKSPSWPGVDFIQRHPRVYGLILKILFDQHVPGRPGLRHDTPRRNSI